MMAMQQEPAMLYNKRNTDRHQSFSSLKINNPYASSSSSLASSPGTMGSFYSYQKSFTDEETNAKHQWPSSPCSENYYNRQHRLQHQLHDVTSSQFVNKSFYQRQYSSYPHQQQHFHDTSNSNISSSSSNNSTNGSSNSIASDSTSLRSTNNTLSSRDFGGAGNLQMNNSSNNIETLCHINTSFNNYQQQQQPRQRHFNSSMNCEKLSTSSSRFSPTTLFNNNFYYNHDYRHNQSNYGEKQYYYNNQQSPPPLTPSPALAISPQTANNYPMSAESSTSNNGFSKEKQNIIGNRPVDSSLNSCCVAMNGSMETQQNNCASKENHHSMSTSPPTNADDKHEQGTESYSPNLTFQQEPQLTSSPLNYLQQPETGNVDRNLPILHSYRNYKGASYGENAVNSTTSEIRTRPTVFVHSSSKQLAHFDQAIVESTPNRIHQHSLLTLAPINALRQPTSDTNHHSPPAPFNKVSASPFKSQLVFGTNLSQPSLLGKSQCVDSQSKESVPRSQNANPPGGDTDSGLKSEIPWIANDKSSFLYTASQFSHPVIDKSTSLFKQQHEQETLFDQHRQSPASPVMAVPAYTKRLTKTPSQVYRQQYQNQIRKKSDNPPYQKHQIPQQSRLNHFPATSPTTFSMVDDAVPPTSSFYYHPYNGHAALYNRHIYNLKPVLAVDYQIDKNKSSNFSIQHSHNHNVNNQLYRSTLQYNNNQSISKDTLPSILSTYYTPPTSNEAMAPAASSLNTKKNDGVGGEHDCVFSSTTSVPAFLDSSDENYLVSVDVQTDDDVIDCIGEDKSRKDSGIGSSAGSEVLDHFLDLEPSIQNEF